MINVNSAFIDELYGASPIKYYITIRLLDNTILELTDDNGGEEE